MAMNLSTRRSSKNSNQSIKYILEQHCSRKPPPVSAWITPPWISRGTHAVADVLTCKSAMDRTHTQHLTTTRCRPYSRRRAPARARGARANRRARARATRGRARTTLSIAPTTTSHLHMVSKLSLHSEICNVLNNIFTINKSVKNDDCANTIYLLAIYIYIYI